jgi:type II secretory pathway component GspD/PulD (secretin)
MKYSLILAALVTLTLPGVVWAQQKPKAAVQRLRNISAADAVQALTTFADENNLPVTVVAEPVSNSVLLAGAAAPLKKVLDQLARLDEAPPSVQVQMIFLEVPVGFAAETGLAEGDEGRWVLTPREMRMLTAAMRRTKERGELDVLSRPQLLVLNNQTGTVEIGGPKLVAHVTPRIGTDGAVTLRLEAEVRDQTARATESVPDGGTLVLRSPRTRGTTTEVLIVATVHRVAPAGK